MNIKLISLVISISLVLMIGGYIVIFNESDTQNDIEFNESNFSDVDQNNLKEIAESELPPSIEKTDPYSYNVDNNVFVKNHSNIIDSNSVTIYEETYDYEETVKKENNKVYLKKEKDNYTLEEFETKDYLLRRSKSSSSTSYDVSTGSISANSYDFSSELKIYLELLNVVSVKQSENNDIIIHLYGDENISSLGSLYGFEEVNTADLYISMNQNGLVKNIDMTITGVSLGQYDTKIKKYQVKDLSNTNINNPEWIRDIKESKTAVEATISKTDNAVRIQHMGLSNIEPNGELTIIEEDSSVYNLTINSRISKGDDIFLVPSPDSWDLSINSLNKTGTRSITNILDKIYYRNNNGQKQFEISF